MLMTATQSRAKLDAVTDRRPHVLLIGSTILWLANVRGDLIKHMLASGYSVTAVGQDYDQQVAATIESWGARYQPLPISRTGLNPFADLRTLGAMYALMRRERPNLFFGYTLKPVVYGLLAAWLAGIPRRAVMITGLGYAFTDGQEMKRRLTRVCATFAYRFALRFAHRTIFQNPDDEQFFLTERIMAKRERAARVNGSGVNLSDYAPTAFPDGPVTFLLIARLLRDKGIYEFARAAQLVKKQCATARFVLVGPHDTNPSSVAVADLDAWIRDGVLEYRGTLNDVRPEIAASHVYVLPSYYREGVPRTVLEAMAMGRPIITADTPGCRETVEHGRNGFLVPPRDPEALAAACLKFLSDPKLIAQAGEASLSIARQKFDAGVVSADILRFAEG
jgi:glycosyltransferase involved in cell wall biosynthesis